MIMSQDHRIRKRNAFKCSLIKYQKKWNYFHVSLSVTKKNHKSNKIKVTNTIQTARPKHQEKEENIKLRFYSVFYNVVHVGEIDFIVVFCVFRRSLLLFCIFIDNEKCTREHGHPCEWLDWQNETTDRPFEYIFVEWMQEWIKKTNNDSKSRRKKRRRNDSIKYINLNGIISFVVRATRKAPTILWLEIWSEYFGYFSMLFELNFDFGQIATPTTTSTLFDLI